MSRYPKVGNATSTTYSTSTTSIPQPPLNTTILPSRLRHEQEQHQLTVSYQSPRSTMTTLPTLPPISTLPYDNFGPYKSPSSEQYRNSPSTPYSASSTTSSFSSYLSSPLLPQPSTPTQIPPSHSQPSYYQHQQQQQQQQQQRSPQTTTYYSQPTYSSYSQYPQQNSPTAQPSPRRTTQQLQQQHYSSQQQPSPIYPPSSSTQQSHTPIRPYQRSHTTQNVISEPFVTVTPELNNRPPRRRRRPPFSYSSLIAQAILDSPDKRLTLREVYQWIMERYPQLYKADDTGWQNTIRHNLSLNKCFKKVPRSDTELGHSTSSSAASKGKGGYWTIDPEYMSAYHDGVFARGGVQKRRPGEVGVGGIHPGMGGTVLGDDDSGGSDTSPSDNNTNMAGRLVEVEDDNESTYHHHPHHHILNHQQQYHYPSHNGSTGERIPLTLTVPPPTSSTSLMTPPLSSSLSQPKKFYVAKRQSEPNFTNLNSPSPLNYSSNVNVNINGSNTGRCDIFNTTDVSNPSSDHSNSHIDIPPYSIESSSGPGSEWSDLSIKREIKMEIDQYYYDNHPAVGEINSSNSSVAGSMKIRNLLN